jgi:hypothetical protein
MGDFLPKTSKPWLKITVIAVASFWVVLAGWCAFLILGPGSGFVIPCYGMVATMLILAAGLWRMKWWAHFLSLLVMLFLIIALPAVMIVGDCPAVPAPHVGFLSLGQEHFGIFIPKKNFRYYFREKIRHGGAPVEGTLHPGEQEGGDVL